jgi:two-component system phosphate regulon sensor histidine kinase PhoR
MADWRERVENAIRAAGAALSPAGQDRAETRSSDGDTVWRAMVDALADAAIVLDSDGRILHHNQAAREMFPRVRTALSLSQVMRHPELIEAADRTSLGAGPIEVQIAEHLPIERRILARLCRFSSDAPGARPAMLLSFRDLTEQDRLAQMRADFVANASHELRTPLASLRGYVETLQGPARNDPKARERFLASMAEQAARMTRLIDDLLSLSRIEMRQHLAPRTVIDLGEAAASAVQTMEPLAAAAQVTLRLVPLDRPARVRADRDEIVQVMQNLVQNAIKYGRDLGQIEVSMSREGGRVAVSVKDDGPGIPPEHLPRLTERFYRVNAGASRDKGGTGLGLAIVKHVMNRHRGDLRITSGLGEGSTFTVVLDEVDSA